MSTTSRTTRPRPRPGSETPAPSRPRRRVLSLSGWPLTGRSMTGAALVVVAVGGVLSAHRAATAPPETTVLAAARALTAGTVLAADDLTAVPADMPADTPVVAGEFADDAVGRTLLRPLEVGALLAPADVGDGGSTRPPGSTVVTVEPAASRVPSDLGPGTSVDVLATDDERGLTELVVRGAVVVGLPGADDGEGTSIGGSLGTRVELAVADETVATALVDAAVRHDLTLVLPTPGSARG